MVDPLALTEDEMFDNVVFVGPSTGEVPMVEAEAVGQMRELAGKGGGAKRIACEPGLARNAVRRYLRCAQS